MPWYALVLTLPMQLGWYHASTRNSTCSTPPLSLISSDISLVQRIWKSSISIVRVVLLILLATAMLTLLNATHTTQFQPMYSQSTVYPSSGHLNINQLLHFQPQKLKSLPPVMQQRRLSTFATYLEISAILRSPPHQSWRTIWDASPSTKTLEIINGSSTLMSNISLPEKAWPTKEWNSSTPQAKTRQLISSPNHSHLNCSDMESISFS